MAFENIRFKYNNFCIAPLINTFASIDTTNATSSLQIRNTSGAVQKNFDLNPSLPINTLVDSLEYTGPRNTNDYADGMPFFTLERVSSTSCNIKRWTLNNTSSRLDLVSTINKTTEAVSVPTVTGTCYYDCSSLTVQFYTTAFNGAVAPDDGIIRVDDTTNMKVGTKLYLGTSTHTSSLDEFEEVEITTISGSYLYINTTTSGAQSPDNYYNSGDDITYYTNLYLFSDTGLNNDTTKGSLFKLNTTTGAVEAAHFSGIYKDVIASTYGLPYGNTIGFTKNSNMYFVDVDDFEVKKSYAMVNIEADERTIIPIYDLAFTNILAYKLQRKTARRSDTGAIGVSSWSSYNYHIDSIIPYVNTITMWNSEKILSNQETTTIYALVRDQYGNVVSSQTVYFDKVSGDSAGDFDNPAKQDDTDGDGIASIDYTSGWYDPDIADSCCDEIILSADTDGSSTYTGSQYVWAWNNIPLKKKYLTNFEAEIEQKIDSLGSITPVIQLEEVTSEYTLPSLSKFWFPGGHGDGPVGSVQLIKQLDFFESILPIICLEKETSTLPVVQMEKKTDTGQLSQTYISRHLSSGHQDTATLNQFRFLLEAIPAFWSEKNSPDTTVWIKLAPFGFDLDQTTLSFRVREISYAGDTGYVEYAGTPNIDVTTFDAGAGLLGLDITVTPFDLFHHGGVVYVIITVYDKAVPANKIQIDYWFKVMQDYKSPYIINESPGREEVDVAVDTDIEFDILDNGVGVNEEEIELYINNRYKQSTITPITGGYHVKYVPTKNFHFGQTVEITVRAEDSSEHENKLFDTYRFYCVSSSGPWFDPESFTPENCEQGVYRKIGHIEMNVYELNDTGLDRDSIKVTIDGQERTVGITPILLRIE